MKLPNKANKAWRTNCILRLFACLPVRSVTSSMPTSIKSKPRYIILFIISILHYKTYVIKYLPSEAKSSWHPGVCHSFTITGISMNWSFSNKSLLFNCSTTWRITAIISSVTSDVNINLEIALNVVLFNPK